MRFEYVGVRHSRFSETGVYGIFNRDRPAVYVGKAQWLYQRMTQHRSDLRRGVHTNAGLQQAWNAGDSFVFRVLERCDDYTAQEAAWLWLSKQLGLHTYNVAPIHAGAPFGVSSTLFRLLAQHFPQLPTSGELLQLILARSTVDESKREYERLCASFSTFTVIDVSELELLMAYEWWANMPPSEQFLDQLLAERLPRRNYRCGTCKHWESDDGQEGECAEEVPAGRLCDFSLAGDGCMPYYFPRQLEWYDE